MNNKKQVINFNDIKIYNLGLKVLLATNKQSNKLSVVIADVNPASCCTLGNVSPGDFLSSINGVEIDSLDTFNNITESIRRKRNTINQITITRKALLDGSDLIKRCLDSPCSEFCGTWNDTFVMKSKKIEPKDISLFATVNPIFTMRSARPPKIVEAVPKKVISSVSSEVPDLSGKLLSVSNPKIKFLQKVQPSSTNKRNLIVGNSSTINVIVKPTKPSIREILTEPQPSFVNRLDTKWYSATNITPDLKQAKSMDNLTDIVDSVKLSGNLSSSSSVDSLSTIKQIQYIKDYKPRKQNPAIIRKQIKPMNRRSIELEDVFTTHMHDRQFIPINTENESKFPNNLLLNLKDKLLKRTDQESHQFIHDRSMSSDNHII